MSKHHHHVPKFDAKRNALAARYERELKLSTFLQAGPIHFWTVNAELIRDKIYIDYVAGGNFKRYHWIPRYEIWIADDTRRSEIMAVCLHELHETNQMNAGLDYDRAHESANKIEQEYRDDHSQLSRLWSHEVDVIMAWEKKGEKSK